MNREVHTIKHTDVRAPSFLGPASSRSCLLDSNGPHSKSCPSEEAVAGGKCGISWVEWLTGDLVRLLPKRWIVNDLTADRPLFSNNPGPIFW